ncbi:MAG: polyphosphate polymerase domain-containing protein [Oribacterium sp.]|nr:polyphosphate polymerase domain-containing protein [Oribacterium sp.]
MALQIFERIEKKFMLTGEQFEKLQPVLEEHMSPDKFTDYTICNIYFDTDNFQLIRNSIEKPKYKEKLRLRSYGVPTEDQEVFLELKKKYAGIVYKRRISMKMSEARRYLYEGKTPVIKDDFVTKQIFREIDYAKNFYGLKPKAFIAYDRVALHGNEDPDLRVTFDNAIRARGKDLELTEGDHGERIIPEAHVLMEVKIPGAMPVWMAEAFAELNINMVSFSKYGAYYKQQFADETGREAKIIALKQLNALELERKRRETAGELAIPRRAMA